MIQGMFFDLLIVNRVCKIFELSKVYHKMGLLKLRVLASERAEFQLTIDHEQGTGNNEFPSLCLINRVRV